MKKNPPKTALKKRLLLALLKLAAWCTGPFFFVSLATFDPLDPTPYSAGHAAAHNWLGHWGALTAGTLHQITGQASWLLACFPVVWLFRRIIFKKKLPLLTLGSLCLGTFFLTPLLALRIPFSGGAAGELSLEYIPFLTQWPWRFLCAFVSFSCLFHASLIPLVHVEKALLNAWIFVLFLAQLLNKTALILVHATLSHLRSKKTKEKNLATLDGFASHTLAAQKETPETKSAAAHHERPDAAWTQSSDGSSAAMLDFKSFRAKHLEEKLIQKKGAAPCTKEEDTPYPDLLSLLAPPVAHSAPPSPEALQSRTEDLIRVLQEFGIEGQILDAHPGPVVTLYAFEPAPGIKSSRVIGLAEDIARSMGALSSRIAVIPGKNALGIELPNVTRETVFLRPLLAEKSFTHSNMTLPLALGRDIGGRPIMADMARMPHLLIAGTTGSGKSVGVNAMILSLLFKNPPQNCQLLMIDPKMLELSVYQGIPHLVSPVITDPKQAVAALKWAVAEMERRYRLLSALGVRNIDGYNQRMRQAKESGQALTRSVQTGFDEDRNPIMEEQPVPQTPLPYIVIIVDEMADLMLVAGKEIEGTIQRLAQMARAAGIHLIMATQRPSVDVLTGTIKANFPSRISFQVTSKIDSRTILGEQGAEQLLGQGDMLYMPPGKRPLRIHGPFVSDDEVTQVIRAIKKTYPDYTSPISFDPEALDAHLPMGDEDRDDLVQQAVQIMMQDKKISTSYIQRKLSIGYNRAARIMDQLEEQGVVSPPGPTGKRTLLRPTG